MMYASPQMCAPAGQPGSGSIRNTCDPAANPFPDLTVAIRWYALLRITPSPLLWPWPLFRNPCQNVSTRWPWSC